MSALKPAPALSAIALGIALLLPAPAVCGEAYACASASHPGRERVGPLPSEGPDFRPPSRAPLFRGHDFRASSRRFHRMSIRRGARPYGDLERRRAFPGNDPYESGRYGHDNPAGSAGQRQDGQAGAPGGTGRPGG
ncbi:MAG: hypothetical protein LBG06_07210 [Deltaproteobacteria bacterium]|jgi:hypothetical protein|nr:hypothetical protein [Deltaproteobacteria bacterium]